MEDGRKGDYQITKSKYANDLSGEGSRLYGSRWTPKGIPVVYVSENRALAALEFYVHGKSAFPFHSFKLVSLDIPINASIYVIDLGDIPPNWRKYPAPTELQKIGTDWVKSGGFILKIPSVQIPNEYNYVLNAAHPDMKSVKVISVEDYNFDPRL